MICGAGVSAVSGPRLKKASLGPRGPGSPGGPVGPGGPGAPGGPIWFHEIGCSSGRHVDEFGSLEVEEGSITRSCPLFFWKQPLIVPEDGIAAQATPPAPTTKAPARQADTLERARLLTAEVMNRSPLPSPMPLVAPNLYTHSRG